MGGPEDWPYGGIRPGPQSPLPHLAEGVLEFFWAQRRATRLKLAGEAEVELVQAGLDRQPPKQAYELSKELPRDLKLLAGILRDEKVPIEVRGKVLEVMLYRSATNDFAYDQMTGKYNETIDDWEAKIIHAARHDEFVERRRYQEAVRDAVFADPRLFDQLSMSKDQMPQGRYPATEFMNTMLRNGGVYGNHDARQKFEQVLTQLPAETRGRMMYHMVDAARTSDIHLKGERRSTGESWEVSVGVEPVSVGLGYGRQWEHVADNHWSEVGNDIRGEMKSDIDSRDQAYKDAHEKGFKDAARLAGRLPGE